MASQFATKTTNIEFHEHLSTGSQIHLWVPMYARTDWLDITGAPENLEL
jgi:hypothetical protein